MNCKYCHEKCTKAGRQTTELSSVGIRGINYFARPLIHLNKPGFELDEVRK